MHVDADMDCLSRILFATIHVCLVILEKVESDPVVYSRQYIVAATTVHAHIGCLAHLVVRKHQMSGDLETRSSLKKLNKISDTMVLAGSATILAYPRSGHQCQMKNTPTILPYSLFPQLIAATSSSCGASEI